MGARWGLLLLTVCAACSAGGPPSRPIVLPSVDASPRRPEVASGRPGRTPLAAPHDAALPFVLQAFSADASRAVIAIAAEDDGVTWARRVDGPEPGPLLRAVDGHVFGAFPRRDGSLTWVTAEGARTCFGRTLGAGDRACAEANPTTIVPVGDRLALLEVRRMITPGGASHRAPRRTEAAPAKPPRPAAKGAKKKRAHAAPARGGGLSHPIVELWLRWAEPDGTIAADASSTDLHFEAPLDGMTLADARPRAGGVDVLWYETAPKRKTRSPLGSGRLMAGSLRPDGKLDFSSRVAVADADLEFGQLKDHRAPRLVGLSSTTTFLARAADNACEAMTVLPTLARLTASATTCTVAPDRIGSERPGEAEAFARILGDDPRRAFGQARGDVGLVAWGVDRGFYLHGEALRSAALADGAPRDEPHPFPAKRAAIAWGTVDVDGEAVASVDGKLVRVSDGGATTAAIAPSLTVQEIASDRRMTVRIGGSVWRARGPRVRLAPVSTGSSGEAPAGEAPAEGAGDLDARVLVGGAHGGISLEVAPSALVVSRVDEAGVASPSEVLAPCPVTVGFDACERGAGGALVAGVSPVGQVVVFTVDAAGHASSPRSVALPLGASLRGVRLVPLPNGGALLTDLERRSVVWLDDEARAIGDAPWPPEVSDVACPYGRPMRRRVPSVTPRAFVELPDTATGACIVGDAVWGIDGALRWLGGTVEGLDFTPELAALPLGAPVTRPPASPTAQLGRVDVPPRACPPEMVSIAGKFCVDRFEASIVDARDGRPLSPDYPTTPNLLDVVLGEWSTARECVGTVSARAFPLPWIAPARVGDKPAVLAVARLGARPSGYLTGVVAASACGAAGKRLCSLDEFVTACRGEADTQFPYGDSFVDGACNVFRDEHPAAILHGNASMGHLDPRLNRVSSHGRPLLQRSGESPACRSRWGDDGAYDMVGNLDEWVDEGAGAFAGGFYSRSTRSGCDALVTNHPKSYLDYSTGVRCCRDVARPAAPR